MKRFKTHKETTKMDIKISIRSFSDTFGKRAIVYRNVENPLYSNNIEVLAANGKWRTKCDADMLFDDEKFEVKED